MAGGACGNPARAPPRPRSTLPTRNQGPGKPYRSLPRGAPEGGKRGGFEGGAQARSRTRGGMAARGDTRVVLRPKRARRVAGLVKNDEGESERESVFMDLWGQRGISVVVVCTRVRVPPL